MDFDAVRADFLLGPRGADGSHLLRMRCYPVRERPRLRLDAYDPRRVSPPVRELVGASADGRAFYLPQMTAWRRLSMGSGTNTLQTSYAEGSNNVGSHISAVSDLGDGSGNQFTLDGSWSSTDYAGGYPFYYWTLRDVYNNALASSASLAYAFSCVIRQRTNPGSSSDTTVWLGIYDETDLTSATVDGGALGLRFSAATKIVCAGRTGDGACTTSTGTGSASVVTSRGYAGNLTNVRMSGFVVDGLDSSNAHVSGASASDTTVRLITDGPFVLGACFGRSASTAGNVTGAVDMYYLPPFALAMPA